MFSDVEYQGREDSDADYIEALQEIYDNNNIPVKDMAAGVRALAYNRAFELVYTIGDGNKTEIKVAGLDPETVFCVYNNDIEPRMICGIRFLKGDAEEEKYKLDVIYADLWQRYSVMRDKQGDKLVLIDERPLFFPTCPVIEYNAEVITDKAPFEVVLPYINALDIVITGNSDEIERLTDALLVIGQLLQPDDLKHMDEIKALMGFKQEDRAEFITKNNDPAFREYVSKLLITEIYRHSHICDWYGTDALSGAISAKALKTRLFDMDMYSKRIEQVYREGAEKRLSLVTFLMALLGYPLGVADIVFNRSTPSDMEELITALNPATFISDQTKCEKVGIDWEIESKRLEEQKAVAGYDVGDLFGEPAQPTPPAPAKETEEDEVTE